MHQSRSTASTVHQSRCTAYSALLLLLLLLLLLQLLPRITTFIADDDQEQVACIRLPVIVD